VAHDVFISHSSKDKPVGDAACAVLEQAGVRCWIAPRDILPGADWSESIIAAIDGCRVLVLLLSGNANASPQVKREVERAVNRGVTIIPMRIEEVMPSRALEYFISMPHWLDAWTPPLEAHLDTLARTVVQLLAADSGEPRVWVPPPPRPWWVRHWRELAFSGLAVAVVTLLVPIALRRDGGGGGGSEAPPQGAVGPGTEPGAVEPATPQVPGMAGFVGTWRLVSAEMQPEQVVPGLPLLPGLMPATLAAAFRPGKPQVTLTVQDLGSYAIGVRAAAGGRYQAAVQPETQSRYIAARGTLTFDPAGGGGVPDRVSATFRVVEPGERVTQGEPGDTEVSFLPAGATGGAALTWVRLRSAGQPPPSVVGTWTSHGLFLDSFIPYSAVLELAEDQGYLLTLQRAESGLLEAQDGRYAFRRSAAAGPPQAGTYRFDGGDKLTLVEPRGTTTWERVDE
jgi:hypothetical protein